MPVRARALWGLLALAGGAGVAVVPTLASGQSPASSASFMAVDGAGSYGYGPTHSWQSSSGGNQATIAQGGTVNFSYSSGAPPQGMTMHNVDFDSGPATPVCMQTQGSSSGAVPPLPHNPTIAGWAGNCTFSTPGTYTFHCDLHGPSMSGTVVAQGSGTTTTSTTGTTGPTTGTTTGTTPPGPTGGPPATAALGAVAVASSQQGTSVHGSADVGQAGSTLTVDLLASRALLARSSTAATASAGHLVRRSATASAGHLVRRSVGPGKVSFSVPLNATARRALRRHRRLALKVKVRVTAPAGRAGTTTRRVTLRR